MSLLYRKMSTPPSGRGRTDHFLSSKNRKKLSVKSIGLVSLLSNATEFVLAAPPVSYYASHSSKNVPRMWTRHSPKARTSQERELRVLLTSSSEAVVSSGARAGAEISTQPAKTPQDRRRRAVSFDKTSVTDVVASAEHPALVEKVENLDLLDGVVSKKVLGKKPATPTRKKKMERTSSLLTGAETRRNNSTHTQEHQNEKVAEIKVDAHRHQDQVEPKELPTPSIARTSRTNKTTRTTSSWQPSLSIKPLEQEDVFCACRQLISQLSTQVPKLEGTAPMTDIAQQEEHVVKISDAEILDVAADDVAFTEGRSAVDDSTESKEEAAAAKKIEQRAKAKPVLVPVARARSSTGGNARWCRRLLANESKQVQQHTKSSSCPATERSRDHVIAAARQTSAPETTRAGDVEHVVAATPFAALLSDPTPSQQLVFGDVTRVLQRPQKPEQLQPSVFRPVPLRPPPGLTLPSPPERPEYFNISTPKEVLAGGAEVDAFLPHALLLPQGTISAVLGAAVVRHPIDHDYESSRSSSTSSSRPLMSSPPPSSHVDGPASSPEISPSTVDAEYRDVFLTPQEEEEERPQGRGDKLRHAGREQSTRSASSPLQFIPEQEMGRPHLLDHITPKAVADADADLVMQTRSKNKMKALIESVRPDPIETSFATSSPEEDEEGVAGATGMLKSSKSKSSPASKLMRNESKASTRSTTSSASTALPPSTSSICGSSPGSRLDSSKRGILCFPSSATSSGSSMPHPRKATGSATSGSLEQLHFSTRGERSLGSSDLFDCQPYPFGHGFYTSSSERTSTPPGLFDQGSSSEQVDPEQFNWSGSFRSDQSGRSLFEQAQALQPFRRSPGPALSSSASTTPQSGPAPSPPPPVRLPTLEEVKQLQGGGTGTTDDAHLVADLHLGLVPYSLWGAKANNTYQDGQDHGHLILPLQPPALSEAEARSVATSEHEEDEQDERAKLIERLRQEQAEEQKQLDKELDRQRRREASGVCSFSQGGGAESDCPSSSAPSSPTRRGTEPRLMHTQPEKFRPRLLPSGSTSGDSASEEDNSSGHIPLVDGRTELRDRNAGTMAVLGTLMNKAKAMELSKLAGVPYLHDGQPVHLHGHAVVTGNQDSPGGASVASASSDEQLPTGFARLSTDAPLIGGPKSRTRTGSFAVGTPWVADDDVAEPY
ncbi:unnamed protein product [Amoebophrya sp. A25]|nr:unnamed protein product [Amoebophrya sp. A25]|eukprot:GSA25T00025428001.1